MYIYIYMYRAGSSVVVYRPGSVLHVAWRKSTPRCSMSSPDALLTPPPHSLCDTSGYCKVCCEGPVHVQGCAASVPACAVAMGPPGLDVYSGSISELDVTISSALSLSATIWGPLKTTRKMCAPGVCAGSVRRCVFELICSVCVRRACAPERAPTKV